MIAVTMNNGHQGFQTLASVHTVCGKQERADVDCTLCCLLYTSPSPRDATLSRMPSSA